MSKNTRKKRRITKPNVFIQSNQPEDSGDSGSIVPESSPPVNAPRVRAQVQRASQRAGVRSEIFTRSLSAELKKIGALSGAVALVLVVLTFVL